MGLLHVLVSGVALRRRLVTIVAAVVLLAGMPAGASADPDPNSCASFRSVFYVMNLPAGYWPTGTNSVEYILTFVLADGSRLVQDEVHSFKVAAGSPAYRGNVLLRLFTNWGYNADGTVNFDANRILPSHPTALFIQEIFDPGMDVSHDTLVARTKRDDHWSDWTAITQGPATSGCEPGGNQHWGGLFWRGHGWQ